MLFQETQFRIQDPSIFTSPERWCITLSSQKPLISQLCLHYQRKWNTILWEIEIRFPSVFPSGLSVKNCFPVLLCIICASTTKHSLSAIILCVSLCLRDFCSSRRPLIKVLSDRLIIKNSFSNIIIKRSCFVCRQSISLKIKFYFQVCYLIYFADMKHTLYNFLKRMKLSFSYFSKKYHFIKVNLFKLLLLLNQKHPLYHHTFQRAILAKFPVQFSSICILCCNCLHRFWKFSGSHFESIMVNLQRSSIDTCYFYLGMLIHFKIKMSLPIDYLSIF